MGYYIELPHHRQKAEQIRDLHGGIIVSQEHAQQALTEGSGVIVVVDNIDFEASAFCYSQAEFDAFTKHDHTGRSKKFVIMERDKAERLSGYRR